MYLKTIECICISKYGQYFVVHIITYKSRYKCRWSVTSFYMANSNLLFKFKQSYLINKHESKPNQNVFWLYVSKQNCIGSKILKKLNRIQLIKQLHTYVRKYVRKYIGTYIQTYVHFCSSIFEHCWLFLRTLMLVSKFQRIFLMF